MGGFGPGEGPASSAQVQSHCFFGIPQPRGDQGWAEKESEVSDGENNHKLSRDTQFYVELGFISFSHSKHPSLDTDPRNPVHSPSQKRNK